MLLHDVLFNKYVVVRVHVYFICCLLSQSLLVYFHLQVKNKPHVRLQILYVHLFLNLWHGNKHSVFPPFTVIMNHLSTILWTLSL
jgi:hypothetical protein